MIKGGTSLHLKIPSKRFESSEDFIRVSNKVLGINSVIFILSDFNKNNYGNFSLELSRPCWREIFWAKMFSVKSWTEGQLGPHQLMLEPGCLTYWSPIPSYSCKALNMSMPILSKLCWPVGCFSWPAMWRWWRPRERGKSSLTFG